MIRFDHIAIAVPRLADAPAVLVGALGGVPDGGAPSGVYRWGQWRFKDGGRLEVLEPTGADGFLHRFLARHGPGVHHVTFKVPSLREACDRARAHGYTIVGYDDADPRWAEAFFHPREALGLVVQLAESRGTGGARPRRWQAPPGPPDPPPPVRILGLRTRARSRERARRQWGTVLGGQSTEDRDGGLGFRWPGSALGITVEIDPAGEEGPLAIELTSERPVELPAGRPALGMAFLQRPLADR